MTLTRSAGCTVCAGGGVLDRSTDLYRSDRGAGEPAADLGDADLDRDLDRDLLRDACETCE